MQHGDVGCSPNDERITTSEQRENVISDKGEALDEIRQDHTPTDRVKGRGKELVGGRGRTWKRMQHKEVYMYNVQPCFVN